MNLTHIDNKSTDIIAPIEVKPTPQIQIKVDQHPLLYWQDRQLCHINVIYSSVVALAESIATIHKVV